MNLQGKEIDLTRIHDNWLSAFLDYTSWGEAPKRMYFWVGVATIAGALERKIWIDQKYFQWIPNMYILLVAPPGVATKTTSANVGMDILKQVPGIKFGSAILTWQSLVQEFEAAKTAFEDRDGVFREMSAITLSSGEFGNTLNTKDRDLVNLLTSVWDGHTIKKSTKYGGLENIDNPCINILACCTPSWIAESFDSYMIGGGLVSRFLFIYADKKDKFIAYPAEVTPKDLQQRQKWLVEDLTKIATLRGEVKLSRAAIEYGTEWYQHAMTNRPANLSDERFSGYLSRKQTHLHKLAMILNVARSNNLVIEPQDLAEADLMLKDLEPDMAFVFSKAGRKELSFHVERFVKHVELKGFVSIAESFRFLHPFIQREEEIRSVIEGCVRSGWIKLVEREGTRGFIPDKLPQG